MIAGARFPGLYLQGEGALEELGAQVKNFGTNAICVIDRAIAHLLIETVERALAGHVQAMIVTHGGECTQGEIDKLVASAKAAGADIVIGIGGGKVIDTAKAAAHALKAASIIVPSIAASDAPCSALSVIYLEDGKVDYDLFLPRNPDMVLVDTQLIANAPARFLAAGIGDALATYYEAEACRASGAKNSFGMPALSVAFEIARACRDTILEFGAEALAECDAHKVGPALERVVEANILLSGIGFESGGVAAAHAVHHGLCELDDVHVFLHGEKVAIGVLAELRLQHASEEEFSTIRDFLISVRLPTRLADIGIAEVTSEKLRIIAERACRPGEIIHNEAEPVNPERLIPILAALA